MTTRKTRAPAARTAGAAAVLALLALAGCATPGPLHVYGVAAREPETVVDRAATGAREVPAFAEPDERVSGFAYDPFTDHFFLRLTPGNRVRVVDRPARAIKREFTVAGVPDDAGGDLAVKPRDGHLFLLDPAGPRVHETTRLGKHLRTFALAEAPGTPSGIAYDAGRDALLALFAGTTPQVIVYDLAGRATGRFTLDRAVGPSLGYDAEAQELYAPLRAESGVIGVFGPDGRLRRTLALPGERVDVGPRSFVRVF